MYGLRESLTTIYNHCDCTVCAICSKTQQLAQKKNPDVLISSCVFVVNHYKLLQIAKIVTYTGFADPDFHL